ncbi:MAG: gliding motility-associated C-terminal domain-containing protein [Bacteroidales bacterium]|nr:gliding motility-associated C-terminal domain-containing protein [Bacteroidales bacterium]
MKILRIEILKFRNVFTVLTLFFACLIVRSEGSRTISPTITSATALLLQPNLSYGSYLHCPSENRIRFVIKDFSTEKLYYGFNWKTYSAKNAEPITNMYLRFFNPSGSQEGSPIKLNSSGPGFISSQGSSVIGPRIGLINLSGYSPLVFSPQTNGEYAIEIYQSNDGGVSQYVSSDSTSWSISPFFDLTVSTAAGSMSKGRVFCKNWAFQPVDATLHTVSQDEGVESIIFPYTDEGAVFQITFQSGFRPGSISLNCNTFGVNETSNWTESRKSINSLVPPQFKTGYKIFLNQPDRSIFPYASSVPAPFFATPTLVGNYPGPYTIRFNGFKKGDCNLILDLDETVGYQPNGADISAEILDCEVGLNEWTWDGKDGEGNYLVKDQLFTLTLLSREDRVNFPLYDAEINTNGFEVSSIAPAYVQNLKLYWDDSQLSNIGVDKTSPENNVTFSGLKNDIYGTYSPARAWSGNGNLGVTLPAPVVNNNENDGLQATDFGNNRILNTWFYASESQQSVSFGSKKISISGTVWNDIDNSAAGSFSNIQSVGETGANADLFVYLVDTTSNTILSYTTVLPSGNFILKGCPTDRNNLKIVISDSLKNVEEKAPQTHLTYDWINTTPLERYFESHNTNISNFNFGIQRKPYAATPNPIIIDKTAGDKLILLPDSLFYGVDYDGGSVYFIRLTEFPTNVRTLSIDNFKYTKSTFPKDGIYLLSDLLGYSYSDISIDPIGLFQDSVKFKFKVIDNGSAEGEEDATVAIAFSPEADLSVLKGVNMMAPLFNKEVIFSVLAKNNGVVDAEEVKVIDMIPTGYDYVGYSATQGTYNPINGNWSIGHLANLDSARMDITYKVKKSGNYSNTAFISGLKPDNIDANNQSTVTPIPIIISDLSIKKTVDNQFPIVGDTINFQLIAFNDGPLDGTMVVIKDKLPNGYAFISAKSTTGSYNQLTGDWSIGNLIVANSDTLAVKCIVTDTLHYINTASISGEQIDYVVTNNVSTVTPKSLQISDLSVVKTANSLSPTKGSRVDFRIVAHNNGPNDASGVNVNDLLPSGFQFSSYTVSQGTFIPATGVWLVGDMNNGANAMLQISCIVKDTGNYVNSAKIEGIQNDYDKLNNSSTISLIPVNPVYKADLSIQKLLNQKNPQFGSRVEFTLIATNNGPDDATGIMVSDLLPSGFSYVTATPSQGAYDGKSGEWSVGKLANTKSATLKITCIVVSDGIYTNSASISGLESDLDLKNNVATVTAKPVPAVELANLDIKMWVDTITPKIGSHIKFILVAKNLGPNNASNVEISDLLNSGFQYIGFTSTRGLYSETSGKWMIGNLTAGDSATLQIECKVLAVGIYINKAIISGLETDVDLKNNSTEVTLLPLSLSFKTDLSILKTINNDSPAFGSRVEFSIIASNQGPDNATGVTVSDILPSGYQYLGSTATQGNYSLLTGKWDIGHLNNNTDAILKLDCIVLNTGEYKNSATITGIQNDPDIANNYSEATPIPNSTASTTDLAVQKSVDNETPRVGDKIRFTILVANIGEKTATGVEVYDQLPDGYTFLSSSVSQGTYSSTSGKWMIGVLKTGSSSVLTIDCIVNSKGEYQNKANVSSIESDSNLANNESYVTPKVDVIADLSIIKSIDKMTPTKGSRVQFTLLASNFGGSDATQVVVSDLLPTGYHYLGFTATQGVYSNETGKWFIGDLSANESAILRIDCIILMNGDYINNASISGGENDNNLTNNFASITPIPVLPTFQIDLQVVKTASNLNPIVGSRVQFMITASNTSDYDATGVEISDLLPDGFQFVSASATTGYFVNNSGKWFVGDLYRHSEVSLTIDCIVLPTGSHTNIAQVSGNESDDNVLNNTSTVSILPKTATKFTDLSVEKIIDNLNPVIGGRSEFTIKAKNNGSDDATGVVVWDNLPSGFKYVSSIATQGDYSNSDGKWTIGDLASGSTVSLRVSCIVMNNSDYTNIAQIAGFESDTILENNESRVDAEPTVSSFFADLEMVKTVNNLNPIIGNDVEFTLVVKNNGPVDATGVEIYDFIPSGYHHKFETATHGAFSLAMGEWGIGNLKIGESAALKIVCEVLKEGSYTNRAFVTGTQADQDLINNESEVTPIPKQPAAIADLSISKIISSVAPEIGSRVEFTIEAMNKGKGNATGVTVMDLLPSGYQFVSSIATQGEYVDQTGVWLIGQMSVDDKATLKINCIVLFTGNFVNRATITGNEFDSDLSNNESSVTSTPVSPTLITDLQVQKTVDIINPTIGSRIKFSIEAKNSGPNNASGVEVYDALPSGFQMVSTTASQGNFNESEGKWYVGELSMDSIARFSMEAIVLSNGDYKNIAYISGIESDNQIQNNISVVTVNPTIPVLNTDLKVSLRVDNEAPIVGSRIEFTILATNIGPDNASGVVVSDMLPAGYQFINSSVSTGTYNRYTGEWQIGSFEKNHADSLKINCIITTKDDYINVAHISGLQSDTILSNNTVALRPNIKQALTYSDLQILKSVDNGTPQYGDQIEFSIFVTNNGPENANGVKVFDALPNGYKFKSFVSTVGAFSETTGEWAVGFLPSGEKALLKVKCDVLKEGNYTNKAIVSSSESDNNLANNESTVTPIIDFIPKAEADEFISPINGSITGNVSENDQLSIDGGNVWSIDTEPSKGNVVFSSDGAFTYTPQANFTGVDQFFYRLQDIDGDYSVAKVMIQVMDKITVPEGFSPNGDMINDYFTIDGIEKYPNNHLTIFSRWGGTVFEASPYTNSNKWNGDNTSNYSFGGSKLPVGIYYYVLDFGNGQPLKKGFFYLNR